MLSCNLPQPTIVTDMSLVGYIGTERCPRHAVGAVPYMVIEIPAPHCRVDSR